MTSKSNEKKAITPKKVAKVVAKKEEQKSASPAVSATPVKSKVETAEIITPKLFEGQEMFWKNKIYLNEKYGAIEGVILQHHWKAFQSTLAVNNVKIKLTDWIADTDRAAERLKEAKAKMRRKLGLKE